VIAHLHFYRYFSICLLPVFKTVAGYQQQNLSFKRQVLLFLITTKLAFTNYLETSERVINAKNIHRGITSFILMVSVGPTVF